MRSAAIPRHRAPRRGTRLVPAVARAAAIMRALGNGQTDARLTDLARGLGIHKSTAHGILATLAAYDLVFRDRATGRYRLGPALVALGQAAGDRNSLGALARPHVARLSRLSGETVTLHLRDREGSVILLSEESPHQLKVTAPPGHRMPPFAGAVAKVLRAFGGPSMRPLPASLPAYTPRSITDRDRYRQELERVRRAGVAYDEMEYLPGVRAISAPVQQGAHPDGEAVGALSIVGVAARVSPEALRRLARPLRVAAQALSQALRP